MVTQVGCTYPHLWGTEAGLQPHLHLGLVYLISLLETGLALNRVTMV